MANEKRLIDANDALEQLKKAEREMRVVTHLGCKAVDIKAVIHYIERIPTVDAVEVVRCKDCKWRQQDEVNRNFCGLGDFYCGDTDFCSRGERRTMKELIDRKDLLAEYDRVHIGPPGGARKLMEDAPAVFVTEVSCEDPSAEYITFPDGLRLIIREGKYAGWYVCK